MRIQGTPANIALTTDELVEHVRAAAKAAKVDSLVDAPAEQLERLGRHALALSEKAYIEFPTPEKVTAWLEYTLQTMISNGVSIEAPPERSDRMKWLTELQAEGPPIDIQTCPFAARVPRATGLDITRASAYVLRDLSHGGALERRSFPVFTPEQRQVYLARMRDVQNALWTGACVELAAKTAKSCPLDTHDVENSTPGFRRPYAELRQSSFVFGGANAPTRSIVDAMKERGTLTQVQDCVEVRSDHSSDGMLAGNFYLRVPVGELGADLSYALAEAARIVMELGVRVGGSMAQVDKELLQQTTLGVYTSNVLREGVASIATTIGLLLAKKPAPPLDTADAALAAVDASQLITQIAAKAPMGVLAPLATIGLVPTDAIGVATRHDGSVRAQLPETLVDVCNAVAQQRREAYTKIAMPEELRGRDRHTETLRGCPVAGRGPVIADDGTMTLTSNAGLSTLTHAFVELTRQILRERTGAASVS